MTEQMVLTRSLVDKIALLNPGMQLTESTGIRVVLKDLTKTNMSKKSLTTTGALKNAEAVRYDTSAYVRLTAEAVAAMTLEDIKVIQDDILQKQTVLKDFADRIDDQSDR